MAGENFSLAKTFGVQSRYAKAVAKNAEIHRLTPILRIELVPQNVIETFAALNTLGYHPIIAITAEQFADADNRRRWIQEKK